MPGVTCLEKQVPGHHVQMDVKFLDSVDPGVRKIRRFQYAAIDDATPFGHSRSTTIRTDNGHVFQVRFHWHVEDLVMRQVCIKPVSPNLNGEVECSHLTDKFEFYRLLDYTDDVDLREELVVWEDFYNVHRPHGDLGGRTPYEVLREKMAS